MKIRRIGLSEQIVDRLATSEIGVHKRCVASRVRLSKPVATSRAAQSPGKRRASENSWASDASPMDGAVAKANSC
jgi:hypothetical protein